MKLNSLIELNNVNKYYKLKNDSLHVLKSINFKINEGDFLMIMGKSGSGKTTLLNLLGLLDSFDDGEYRLKGKNVIGLNENERSILRNLNMGFIFQQFHLIDSLTIGQNVELPLLYKGGVAKKNREKLVNKYLDLVGLRSK